MSPVVNCLCAFLPFFNHMWIVLENNLDYFLISNYMTRHVGLSCALWAKTFLINISSHDNMKHPICQPLEHWLQINIIATPVNCSHNIQKDHIRPTTKDGSFWPSTVGKWYDAQLCKWSFHVWQSWTSNNGTLENNTLHTFKMTHPIVTSNIIDVVYFKWT